MPATSRVGRVPGSEASGKAYFTSLWDALHVPPPLSYRVVVLRFAGQDIDAGDPGALPAPGAHKAPSAHPPTVRAAALRAAVARALEPFPRRKDAWAWVRHGADWVHGEGPGGEG